MVEVVFSMPKVESGCMSVKFINRVYRCFLLCPKLGVAEAPSEFFGEVTCELGSVMLSAEVTLLSYFFRPSLASKSVQSLMIDFSILPTTLAPIGTFWKIYGRRIVGRCP